MAKSKRISAIIRDDYEKRSGLNDLRQFIPDSDYTDALIEHVGKNAPALNDEGERPEVRNRMIEKSIAVLSYLRDNGYDFSVETDRREGQLTAKLADSNISIRLLDSDANSQYVGRVYDDGVIYNFSSGRNSLNKGGSIDVTPEMAVDLVRYAMGESVSRINKEGDEPIVLNEKVGTAEVGERKYGAPHTYLTADGNTFTTLYSKGKATIRQNADGKPINVSGDIFFKCDSTKKQNGRVRFDGEDAAEKADNFITASREAAVNNFTAMLKLEAVDTLARMRSDNEFEGMPEFSDNKIVADMQKDYYSRRLEVYKNKEAYPDDVSRAEVFLVQDNETKKNIDQLFGDVELRSINPINVAAYMNQSRGLMTNEADLLTALKTVQKNGNGYALEGDGFAENGFKEKMVAYSSEPVYDNNGNQIYPKDINPEGKGFDKLPAFWQNIGSAVRDSLSETGVRVNSIQVDENGVIHYEGDRHVGASPQSKPDNKVIGNIGQVFEPDIAEYNPDGSANLKHGLIRTKFNSGENYYIAPGYTAYVVPPVGENSGKTFEERTRLRGYTQEMVKEIKSTLRHDIITNDNYDNTSGLNGVYHHIYGDKFALDFEEQMRQEGKDTDMIKAINETALRRVRYDSCYKDGTSILSKMNAEKRQFKPGRGYDMYLDNVQSNMAVMDADTARGIFDPSNTGTGTNQGIVRYLTSDAVVNPDGSITRGQSELCPLVAHEDFKYSQFNPPDRSVMSMMNAMNQSSTARGRDVNLSGEKIEPIGVGTAHMALGGYTQDDAFVVSKDFADANMIRGKDGNMRPLQIGDKICDHSGNKGVISFIADRNADMSYYEPDPIAEGMTEKQCRAIDKRNDTKALQRRTIDVFKDNPALDVIGAPYTAPSRFNGGTAREMIDSQAKAHAVGMPTELNINGDTINGGIGYTNWIVTDMPVDEKTHIYEFDGDGGRKASGQLVWALSELGAKDLIDEIYKFNNEPVIKTREMMIMTGLDLSETGEIHRGYRPHITGVDDSGKPVVEQRNEFSVREIFDRNRDAKGTPHDKNFKAEFDTLMGEDGGFMKLPFPLQMASGDMTPQKLDSEGKGTGEYMMPVLAGKYRSGRETVDNKLVLHEYTAYYKSIYEAAGKYLKNEELRSKAANNGGSVEIGSGKTKTVKTVADLTTEMNAQVEAAQRAYNTMADNVVERYFEGKHNIFKDEVMRKQLHGTATAVVSPDGSLDLDEVSITATMAKSLGIDVDAPNAEDTPIVIWRDPLLSGGGMRQVRPRIIENRPGFPGYDSRNPLNNQIGMGMNPSAATSFEGDFDGDSFGLYVPQTKAGIKCAREKLSFTSQILNREAGEKGQHSAYFQDGLDVAAGQYYDELNGGNVKERMSKAIEMANQADKDGDRSVGRNSVNGKAFEMFNDAMHDAQNAAFGHDVISYASPEEHIKSLIPMVRSGAKGSPKKLMEGYAPYFGAKFEIDENFEVKNFEDIGKPYVTKEQRQASFAATHAKAYLTGVAGKFSQHAEMMALNLSDDKNGFSCSAAATALTHPVTQSVMQLKHDTADEIVHKIDMIQTVAPALWAGQKIEPCIDANGKASWHVMTQKNPENGKDEPVAATPEEWKKMFNDFYTDKNGLNVPMPNPEHIETMAKIMTVEQNGRRFIKGFDSKTKEILPTEQPLTRMAYEGNFNTLVDYADREKKGKPAELFAGSVSSVMAPKVIRDNLAEKARAEADPDYVPKFKALAAKDTQCKPSVDTPSVNVVDKYLKERAASDIHMSGIEQPHVDNKSNEMPVMKSDSKSYADLDIEERTNLFNSIAEKIVAKKSGKDVSLTAIEKEAYDLSKQQNELRRSLGTEAAVNEYEAAHPDAFAEWTMQKSAINVMMNKAKSENQSVLDNLSQQEYLAVAKSVTDKYVVCKNGEKPVFETEQEIEFNKRLQEQSMKLDTVAPKERNQYIKDHKDEMKERISYAKLRHEAEHVPSINQTEKLDRASELSSVKEGDSKDKQHNGLG